MNRNHHFIVSVVQISSNISMVNLISRSHRSQKFSSQTTKVLPFQSIRQSSLFSIRPISQIPECSCSISHNAPFRTEMCTFLFWMEHTFLFWMKHCGVWKRCILGFVNQVHCSWYTPHTATWWHHQMETFSALLALCEGNSPVRWIHITKASDTDLWCFL